MGDGTASKAVYLAKPDPISNDQRVESVWNRNASSNAFDLLVRWTGGNNYYRLQTNVGTNLISLTKMVAGVNTVLATYPWIWANNPRVAVGLQAVGTSISATIDGIDQAPVVDASLAAGDWGIQYAANADVIPTAGVSLQRFTAYNPTP